MKCTALFQDAVQQWRWTFDVCLIHLDRLLIAFFFLTVAQKMTEHRWNMFSSLISKTFKNAPQFVKTDWSLSSQSIVFEILMSLSIGRNNVVTIRWEIEKIEKGQIENWKLKIEKLQVIVKINPRALHSTGLSLSWVRCPAYSHSKTSLTFHGGTILVLFQWQQQARARVPSQLRPQSL